MYARETKKRLQATTDYQYRDAAVLNEMIRIKVEDGVVTLEGEVEWEFQRSRAAKSIENLPGVRFVNNLVRLNPKVAVADVEKQIAAAFRRSANIDAGKIHCEAQGGFLTLRGEVRSFAEKKDAEHAAWNVPGVITVNNKLEVKVPEYVFED